LARFSKESTASEDDVQGGNKYRHGYRTGRAQFLGQHSVLSAKGSLTEWHTRCEQDLKDRDSRNANRANNLRPIALVNDSYRLHCHTGWQFAKLMTLLASKYSPLV
jgi:hypothetical protein